MGLVLIALRQRRKKLVMHRRAVRALQVVEADNQHRSIRRSTPRRPAISAHQQLRVLADVVLVELRQRLSVRRKQKRHRLPPFLLAPQRYSYPTKPPTPPPLTLPHPHLLHT